MIIFQKWKRWAIKKLATVPAVELAVLKRRVIMLQYAHNSQPFFEMEVHKVEFITLGMGTIYADEHESTIQLHWIKKEN